MALPQYKLHSEVHSFVQGSFPVILAPADPPQKLERLKYALRSKQLLTMLVVFSIMAGATLLWLALDPMLKAPKPSLFLIPAATLAACLLFFVIVAIARKSVPPMVAEEAEHEMLPPALRARVAPKPSAPQVEVNCEEWSSAPYLEIIDDAVIAEIFNDEMVAPDHMVFILKVKE